MLKSFLAVGLLILTKNIQSGFLNGIKESVQEKYSNSNQSESQPFPLLFSHTETLNKKVFG